MAKDYSTLSKRLLKKYIRNRTNKIARINQMLDEQRHPHMSISEMEGRVTVLTNQLNAFLAELTERELLSDKP